MGQTIQILESVQVDNVLLVTTDRSFTGQDGESFTGPLSAKPVDTFGARLAVRLFEADSNIDHVYVMSNGISIRRRGGWDPAPIESILEVVSWFFRFYRDQDEPAEPAETAPS